MDLLKLFLYLNKYHHRHIDNNNVINLLYVDLILNHENAELLFGQSTFLKIVLPLYHQIQHVDN